MIFGLAGDLNLLPDVSIDLVVNTIEGATIYLFFSINILSSVES